MGGDRRPASASYRSGRNAPAACPFDLVDQVPRRREAVATGQAPRERADQPPRRIQDRRQWRSIVACGPVMAQLGEGRGVEGPCRHRRHPQAPHASDHLRRGLVRERDQQRPFRVNGADRDRMGDTVGDHARLARSRAGQDHHRAGHGKHGITLRLVEAVQQPLRVLHPADDTRRGLPRACPGLHADSQEP